MTPRQREAAVRDARAFKEYQLAPDSPEDLARIPSLRRSDIPPNVERIPHQDTTTPRPECRWPCTTSSPTRSSTSTSRSPPTGSPGEHVASPPAVRPRRLRHGACRAHATTRSPCELFRLTGGFSASLDAGGIAGQPDGFGQFMFFRTRCLRHNLPEAADLVGAPAGRPRTSTTCSVCATSSSSCATT